MLVDSGTNKAYLTGDGLDVNGKSVLVRSDLIVPLEDRVGIDDLRIPPPLKTVNLGSAR